MDKKKTLPAAVGAVTGLAAKRAGDAALIGAGVTTAVGAVAFAGYMTMSGDHPPSVNGMQYLAIFSQPSHPHHADDASPSSEIDMNPVGAISRNEKDRVGGYQLVGAQERFAWLREGDHIFAVHPGDDVPRLGRIATIEQREGRWTLLDENGSPLIVSALADVTPSPGGRFDKRMIFGNGR